MSNNVTVDFAVTDWTQCTVCSEFIPQEYAEQHVADHEVDGPNMWRCWYPNCRRIFKKRMTLHQHQGKMHRYTFTW